MPGVRKELPCEECGKVIKGKLYLLDHKSRIHGFEGKHECTFCGKRFARTDEYTKHLDAHTGVKRYKCKFCEKYFTDHSNRAVHIKNNHTENNPVKCDKCHKLLKSDFYLRRHVKLNHEKSNTENTCNHCQKSFSRKDSLITHMRLHTGEKPYKCNECNKSFYERSLFGRHKKTHIPKDQRTETFPCKECASVFTSYQILYRHKVKEHGNQVYKCDVCEYSTKFKRDLSDHSKAKHELEQQNANYVNCDSCGKEVRPKKLSSHVRLVHRESRRYSCSVCEYKTSTKSNLNTHMLFHLNKRDFKCEICDEAFFTSQSRQTHVKAIHMQ